MATPAQGSHAQRGKSRACPWQAPTRQGPPADLLCVLFVNCICLALYIFTHKCIFCIHQFLQTSSIYHMHVYISLYKHIIYIYLHIFTHLTWPHVAKGPGSGARVACSGSPMLWVLLGSCSLLALSHVHKCCRVLLHLALCAKNSVLRGLCCPPSLPTCYHRCSQHCGCLSRTVLAVTALPSCVGPQYSALSACDGVLGGKDF